MLVGLSGLCCSSLLQPGQSFSPAPWPARAEFAVRSALGASRSQVLRPVDVRRVLLLAFRPAASAPLGRLLDFDWLAAGDRRRERRRAVLAFDWHVLAWAFCASLFTALASAAPPCCSFGASI